MTSNEYKAKVIHLLRRLIRKKIMVALSNFGLIAKDGVHFQKSRLFVFLMAFFEFLKKSPNFIRTIDRHQMT